MKTKHNNHIQHDVRLTMTPETIKMLSKMLGLDRSETEATLGKIAAAVTMDTETEEDDHGT